MSLALHRIGPVAIDIIGHSISISRVNQKAEFVDDLLAVASRNANDKANSIFYCPWPLAGRIGPGAKPGRARVDALPLKEFMGHAMQRNGEQLWAWSAEVEDAGGVHSGKPVDAAGWENAESDALTMVELTRVLETPAYRSLLRNGRGLSAVSAMRQRPAPWRPRRRTMRACKKRLMT
jgi:hypothetical protein